MDQAGVEVGSEELAARRCRSVTSPMPGPLLPSIVANSETAPLTPSIFQMAPGTAAIALGELALHEGGAGLAAPLPLGTAVAVFVRRDDAEAVQRGCPGIEVGHAGWRRRATPSS